MRTSQTLSAKGRQTRQAIEQAARKLFAERGFHGTTLADITSAAGKSPAAFYRYYADKEDLLAALAESFLHEMLIPSGLSVQLPESPDDTGSSRRWSPATGTSSNRTSASWSPSPNSARPSSGSPWCRTNSGSSAWTSSRPRYSGPRSKDMRRDLQPRARRSGHRIAVRELHHRVPAAIRPGTGDQRRGRRRNAVDDMEEDAVRVLAQSKERSLWISRSRNIFRDCWPRWTRSSRPRSNRWNAKTCSTSTGIANSPAPTWTTAVSRRGRGRTCSARCGLVPTRPAGCATDCRRSSVAATAPTWTWPSSGNTWRTRDSDYTTTCRTSRRSSATSRRSS